MTHTDSRLENVIAARAKIADPKKWVRGYYTRKGCMCAWEALRSTIVGGKPGDRVDQVASGELLAVARLFVPHIPMDRIAVVGFGMHPIIRFNDNKQTTHAEVLGVFDQVIKRLQP